MYGFPGYIDHSYIADITFDIGSYELALLTELQSYNTLGKLFILRNKIDAYNNTNTHDALSRIWKSNRICVMEYFIKELNQYGRISIKHPETKYTELYPILSKGAYTIYPSTDSFKAIFTGGSTAKSMSKEDSFRHIKSFTSKNAKRTISIL